MVATGLLRVARLRGNDPAAWRTHVARYGQVAYRERWPGIDLHLREHTHFDHVSGNVDFPATVDIVTHENTAELMREMRPPAGFPNVPRNMLKDTREPGSRSAPSRTN